MKLILSFPNERFTTVHLLKGMPVLFPHCTLNESSSSSNSLTGYSSTCGKLFLRYLSLITETCAPVSSNTGDNLLFSRTLMRHFSPINLVTLCFCFLEMLTVYDPLLNTSSYLSAVKVEMALHTCLWSFQDCIWQFLPQKILIYTNCRNILYHLIFYCNITVIASGLYAIDHWAPSTSNPI